MVLHSSLPVKRGGGERKLALVAAQTVRSRRGPGPGVDRSRWVERRFIHLDPGRRRRCRARARLAARGGGARRHEEPPGERARERPLAGPGSGGGGRRRRPRRPRAAPEERAAVLLRRRRPG